MMEKQQNVVIFFKKDVLGNQSCSEIVVIAINFSTPSRKRSVEIVNVFSKLGLLKMLI